MSLNAAHELLATRNAVRANKASVNAGDTGANPSEHASSVARGGTLGGTRSRRAQQHQDYFSSPSAGNNDGGGNADTQQNDDWWEAELEGDLEHFRRHGFGRRQGGDEVRGGYGEGRVDGKHKRQDKSREKARLKKKAEDKRKDKGRGLEVDHHATAREGHAARHRNHVPRDYETLRREAEEARRYDYYRPHLPVGGDRRARKHRQKLERKQQAEMVAHGGDTPLAMASPTGLVMPSPSGGIGAAIAAAAGIAGGIAGVEREPQQQQVLVGHGENQAVMKHAQPWTVLDVKESRAYRRQQQDSTLSTLTSLADRTTGMTASLDATYSAIFDRLTDLNAAVYAFKDLLDVTAELRAQLDTRVAGLKADADTRVRSIDTFAPQIAKINALQQRMAGSRERVAELTRRLGTARERIARWHQSEDDWAVNFRKKVRVGLGIAMAVSALLIAVHWLRVGWPFSSDSATLLGGLSGGKVAVSRLASQAVCPASGLDPLDVCLNPTSLLVGGFGT
ncbi:hypothetical protein KEM52_006722 [Ascosphaera acerosa]|nr:hypothetical protein KEM52_006722 [Ascosphaera acerosa]